MRLSGGDSWRHAGKRVCALVTVLLLVVAVPSAGAAPGDLDSGFSSDGKLLTDIGTTDSGRAVAIQSDGKIVVAGYALMGSDDDFAVARYGSDGALDGTFSSDGLTTIDFDNKNESAYAVAIQTDGKIVVAGRAATDGMGLTFDFAVARLTTSGALDETFSSDGLLTVDVGGGNDYGYAIDVASDGDIVVVGYGSNGSNWDVAAIRLDSSGNLDTGFSSDGKALYAVGSGHDYGYGLDIASDGDLLVTGSSHNGSDDDVLVLRLDGNGNLDTAFDADGIWTADIGSGTADVGWGIIEASDGDVLVGGSSDGGDDDVLAVRLTASGVPDTAFSGDGKVTVAIGSANDVGYGISEQVDGSVVVAGTSYDGSAEDVAVVRFTASGVLDTTFSGDGKLTTSIGSGDGFGYGVVASSSGVIAIGGQAVGTSDTDFAVLVYEGASAPGVPTSLAGTAGNAEVSLSWTAPTSSGGASLTGYKVESSTNSGSSWSTVTADTESTSTSYTATSLTNGTGYMFRVSAINSVGTGSTSDTTSSTPRTTPGEPTSLSGTAGNAEVSLSWTAPTSNGGASISGYKVESSTNGGSTWSTSIADTGSSSTSAVVDGLSNGTAVAFRVSAINVAGTGSASDTEATTPRTRPGQPTGLSATESSTQVELSWSAPSSDGGSAVTGYKVERSTNSGLTWTTVVADTGSTSTSSTVSGLTNGTSYAFRISAVNAAGTGTGSSTVTATPRTTSDAPTGLAGTPGDQQVTLAWTAPSGSGGTVVTGYRVERSADGGSTWTTVVADTGSTTTAYTVTGLTNGSAYSFRTAAVNDAGTGSMSSTASATPRTTPGPPTGVAPVDGDTQSALSWTAPGSDGGVAVTGYRIEQSTDGGTTWTTVVADTESTSTAYTVTGLTNGSTYDFRVSAVNAAGTGAASSSAGASPVAPTTTTTAPTTSVGPTTTTSAPTTTTSTTVPATTSTTTTTTVPATTSAPTGSTSTTEPASEIVPPPLPPMTIIDGRLYQDGGIPLPPHYLD